MTDVDHELSAIRFVVVSRMLKRNLWEIVWKWISGSDVPTKLASLYQLNDEAKKETPSETRK